jgi:uncharacterized tellurite resistance protein B-like protein
MDPVRHSIVSRFSPEDRINFLAVLFRLARADEVSAQERNRLQPVARWMNADPGELQEVMKRADDPSVTLSGLVAQHRAPDRGLLLFRECCAVVWVDGTRSEAEERLLTELAGALSLSEETRRVLDTPLACSPEGERRFLEHLGGTSPA